MFSHSDFANPVKPAVFRAISGLSAGLLAGKWGKRAPRGWEGQENEGEGRRLLYI